MKTSTKLLATLDLGSHSNAHAQRRGQDYHLPLNRLLRSNAPLSPRPLQCVVSQPLGAGSRQ
jgi:hypothetical protein